MARPPQVADTLPEALQFRPRWWWDPVPPWLVVHLDRQILVELASVQLQLQKDVLAAESRAIDASLKLLGQVKG